MEKSAVLQIYMGKGSARFSQEKYRKYFSDKYRKSILARRHREPISPVYKGNSGTLR